MCFSFYQTGVGTCFFGAIARLCFGFREVFLDIGFVFHL